jgi:hypothetical protein
MKQRNRVATMPQQKKREAIKAEKQEQQAAAQPVGSEAETYPVRAETRKRFDAEMKRLETFEKLLFSDIGDTQFGYLHEDAKTVAVFAYLMDRECFGEDECVPQHLALAIADHLRQISTRLTGAGTRLNEYVRRHGWLF